MKNKTFPPPSPVQPVVHTPFKKHTYADGTTVAPVWRPPHLAENTNEWNVSHEESVRRPNFHGDPIEPRKQREDFNLPPEKFPTVRFEAGRKIVEHESEKPLRLPTLAEAPPHRPSGPRRRIVGQRNNPNASVKPLGTFTPDND